jgi:hypothetical protein
MPKEFLSKVKKIEGDAFGAVSFNQAYQVLMTINT